MTAPLASPPPNHSFVRPAVGLLAGLGITALLAGFGIVIATLAMLRGVDPATFRPSSANLIVYLVINAIGAFAGGFTTARITVGRSFYTVFLFAFVLLTSAMVFVLRAPPAGALAEPRWFALARAITVVIAALLGGYIERRRQATR